MKKEDLELQISKILEERDGLQIRVNALEAKANAQEKRLELREKVIKDLGAAALAAESLSLKAIGLAIEKAYRKGAESVKPVITCDTPVGSIGGVQA